MTNFFSTARHFLNLLAKPLYHKVLLFLHPRLGLNFIFRAQTSRSISTGLAPIYEPEIGTGKGEKQLLYFTAYLL